VEGDHHGGANPQAVDQGHDERQQELRQAHRRQLRRAQPPHQQGIHHVDAPLQQVAADDRKGKAQDVPAERGLAVPGGPALLKPSLQFHGALS
jgi:hypothetical protein